MFGLHDELCGYGVYAHLLYEEAIGHYHLQFLARFALLVVVVRAKQRAIYVPLKYVLGESDGCHLAPAASGHLAPVAPGHLAPSSV